MSDEARGGAAGAPQVGRCEPVPTDTPVGIETCPTRHQVSVDARLVRLARSAVVRHEDFLLPPGTWEDLHRLTTRSIDRSSRGGR